MKKGRGLIYTLDHPASLRGTGGGDWYLVDTTEAKEILDQLACDTVPAGYVVHHVKCYIDEGWDYDDYDSDRDPTVYIALPVSLGATTVPEYRVYIRDANDDAPEPEDGSHSEYVEVTTAYVSYSRRLQDGNCGPYEYLDEVMEFTAGVWVKKKLDGKPPWERE